VSREEREGHEDLEDEQGTLGERIEHGDQPVHGVQAERRHRRNVARAEERRVQQEQREQADAQVRQRQRAPRRRRLRERWRDRLRRVAALEAVRRRAVLRGCAAVGRARCRRRGACRLALLVEVHFVLEAHPGEKGEAEGEIE